MNTEFSEELWDKYSTHIDDNVDSFQQVAGSLVITRSDFIKAMHEYASQHNPLKAEGKVGAIDIDKPLQDVYIVPFKKDRYGAKAHDVSDLELIENVYIHTPEELDKLIKKKQREAAEKALDKGMGIGRRALVGAPYYPSDEKYIKEQTEIFLNTNYPL